MSFWREEETHKTNKQNQRHRQPARRTDTKRHLKKWRQPTRRPRHREANGVKKARKNNVMLFVFLCLNIINYKKAVVFYYLNSLSVRVLYISSMASECIDRSKIGCPAVFEQGLLQNRLFLFKFWNSFTVRPQWNSLFWFKISQTHVFPMLFKTFC